MNSRRFRPVAYFLSDTAIQYPLQQSKVSATESQASQISVWNLLSELEGKSYRTENQLTRLVIELGSETRTIQAHSCIIEITELLLEAWRQGIRPLELSWFWLETDSFDAGIAYTFFVVERAGDRILREHMRVIEPPEDHVSFERSVRALFDSDNYSRTSGVAAYWYGRFYRETRVGKILTLASGWRKPRVFYRRDDGQSNLRLIRNLLIAIFAALLVLIFRRS